MFYYYVNIQPSCCISLQGLIFLLFEFRHFVRHEEIRFGNLGWGNKIFSSRFDFFFFSLFYFERITQDLNTEVFTTYQKGPSKMRGNNKISKDIWLIQNSNRLRESPLHLSYMLMLPKPPCPREENNMAFPWVMGWL